MGNCGVDQLKELFLRLHLVKRNGVGNIVYLNHGLFRPSYRNIEHSNLHESLGCYLSIVSVVLNSFAFFTLHNDEHLLPYTFSVGPQQFSKGIPLGF